MTSQSSFLILVFFYYSILPLCNVRIGFSLISTVLLYCFSPTYCFFSVTLSCNPKAWLFIMTQNISLCIVKNSSCCLRRNTLDMIPDFKMVIRTQLTQINLLFLAYLLLLTWNVYVTFNVPAIGSFHWEILFISLFYSNLKANENSLGFEISRVIWVPISDGEI